MPMRLSILLVNEVLKKKWITKFNDQAQYLIQRITVLVVSV